MLETHSTKLMTGFGYAQSERGTYPSASTGQVGLLNAQLPFLG